MISDKWRSGRSVAGQEVNKLPSMVENCHNPSIAEMLANPNCMLQHVGYYDDDPNSEDIDDSWENDFLGEESKLFPHEVLEPDKPEPEPDKPEPEPDKPEPELDKPEE